MYGLPQAVLLDQYLIEDRLSAHEYHQNQLILGLWKHDTRPITFTLVVGDFGVIYVNKEDVKHLMNDLKETYTVTEDWEGEKYVGIHLRWDYANKKVHLAMPGYVQDGLQQFNHEPPKCWQESLYIIATPHGAQQSSTRKHPKNHPAWMQKGRNLSSKSQENSYF